MIGRNMRFGPVSRNLAKLLDIKSMKLMDQYALYNPSPLTLKQFVDFGRSASEAESFAFLKKEVPVRLANIMKEFNLLPSNLLQMPSVVLLQEWYARSFMELCAFEGKPVDRNLLKEYVRALAVIQRRHVNAVQTMAMGVLELKESHSVDHQTENSIQYFLDRFYMSRISTRMLTTQHYVLFGSEDESTAAYSAEDNSARSTNEDASVSSDSTSGRTANIDPSQPHRIGVIDAKCRLKTIVKEAFNNAAFLCEEYYFMAPDLDLEINNVGETDEPIEICYPQQHLYHILFELFKNSMRAVVEIKKRGQLELPDVRVLIARGADDVSIRVSDRGGGISRHVTDRLFQYLYSTAPRPSMQATKAPLAGYGYGLPLSRLYARYFHGDLILNSYDGYGTDAVVYLKARPEEAIELLPVFNKTSTKQYRSAVPAADWTDPASLMNRHYHPTYQSKALSNA